MADAPDFEALRAARNAAVRAMVQKQCEEMGWSISEVRCSHNDDACYCACATGGPCEHKWDGEGVEFDGGWSATCSRCGCTAMSHDLRVLP